MEVWIGGVSSGCFTPGCVWLFMGSSISSSDIVFSGGCQFLRWDMWECLPVWYISDDIVLSDCLFMLASSYPDLISLCLIPLGRKPSIAATGWVDPLGLSFHADRGFPLNQSRLELMYIWSIGHDVGISLSWPVSHGA